MAFICELYETQLHGGRCFLHAHSHSADSWEQSTVVDFMKRFPDTFQTVTDRSFFGLNVPHCMNALTRWLTNSGHVAQALSSLNHSSTLRQTIMSAMSQQLQSDLGVAGTSDPLQHRPPLPKRDIVAVDEEPLEEWEAEDDVKGGQLDPREDKKLHVRRKQSICGTWRCTSTPPNRRHGRAKDANQLASSGLIPTKEAPKPHVIVRVWCARRCAMKGSNRPSRKHLRWETLRILLGVACQEDVFQVEDPFLISIADVSRAHFYADAVRDVYVRLPDEDPKAKVCGKLRKTMYKSLDAAQHWGEHYAQGGGRVFPRCGFSVPLLL